MKNCPNAPDIAEAKNAHAIPCNPGFCRDRCRNASGQASYLPHHGAVIRCVSHHPLPCSDLVGQIPTGCRRIQRHATPHRNTQGQSAPDPERDRKQLHFRKDGWGGRIRTYGTRYQKPLPYHLATPQLLRLFREADPVLQAKISPRSATDEKSQTPQIKQKGRPKAPSSAHKGTMSLRPISYDGRRGTEAGT